MVRETRHLWVGNLPDNIREDRIREHFKRYGRVQNVKLLGRTEGTSAPTTTGAVSGVCATVAFMDIKSASKAHNAEHVLDERTLTTEYYEPAAIPSAAGAPSAGSSPAGSGYSGSSSSVNSAPAPAPTPRYHLSGGEEVSGTCALAATAAAPANWRGTNDSASEFCRRGNTPATYGRYQRNNSTAPYSTPPSNVERTTPHPRWYTSGDRERGATGGESTPSTPGGGTEGGGRRRRRSGSGSSRSESSSPEPSDGSRASSPRPGHLSRTPPATQSAGSNHHNHHQWSSTASGRPLAICVRNLPTRSTDSSLKDGLYHEYKKHGKVVWVKVVGQNADRYAVVRFKKPSDVEKALEVSQDKLFFGCKISVAPHQSCDEDADSAKPYETDIDEYHPKATRTLFIGNLEKDVTQQQLRDKFKPFGRIIEIDIKKGSGGGAGYAFCQYAAISSVVEAIRAMDGEYVGGSRVKLGFGKPVATTCVWIDGLTEHTEKQVLSCVSRCGGATSVCVDRAAGAALVHFEQAIAAGAAVRELRRVAAHVSAADPDRPRLAVDYASRECQEAFYEQLEKHGGSNSLSGSERLAGEVGPRYVPRHDSIRFDGCASTRSRGSSFTRGCSRTPRYSSLEHFDPAEYPADRRYRVYDELGSSPQTEEATYDDRLQSVVVSPHRARRHRRDSSPEDRKHSKERHRGTSGTGSRRSRSGSRGGERHAGRRRHRRRRDGSGSRGSRTGTPLRDELDAPPTEPRKPPRDRPPLPMSLPLPKFAAQLLRSAAAAPRTSSAPASAPDSPPRPPSASSSSAGSAPHSPSLEERIRSLDEKYEKWSGSRAQQEAPDRARLRHRLLEVDINEVKPSEVVRSLLAKRSVFDEDSERLEGARGPSPSGSPRGRPPPCVPRALRYPFPAHASPHTSPATPSTPATPATPTYCGIIGPGSHSSQEHDTEVSDRPIDPRLNRPERTFQLERLGKISESDYRLESKIRLRTPSTDKSQPDSRERRQSTGGEQDKIELDRDPRRELERRRRNSLYSSREGDTRLSLNSDDKDIKEAIERINTEYQTPERITSSDSSEDKKTDDTSSDKSLVGENLRLDIKDSETKNIENIETKMDSAGEIESVTKTVTQNIVEKESEQCTNQSDSKLDNSEGAQSEKDHDEEAQYHGENDLSNIELPPEKDNDKCKDILMQNHINKELHDIEVQHSHLNVMNTSKQTKEFAELPQEFIKSHDKNGEKRYDQNILETFPDNKSEKENIEFDKSADKDKVSPFLGEKKHSDTEKHFDDRVKHERDKAKHSKEKDKHDQDKDKSKNHKNERPSEKIEKEKKCKEDFDKSHVDKTDKTKDTDKLKHEEKTRHEHHRKDKRKDSVDNDGVKTKKEEKHKHEKTKKDCESKRDSKKDSDPCKNRKSSRDETSKDLSRKDSTDSSTSRTSYDSTKLKEPEQIEIKEESKPKLKYFDLFANHEKNDKELLKNIEPPKMENIKVKSEIKEEKEFYDHKVKVETSVETPFKCKPEVIEKQRHYSLDSPSIDGKRKERLNSCSSLPSNIGHKRRMSSQDSIDSFHEDIKKSKSDSKCLERRDSKDSRSSDRHKTTKFNKGHFAKIIESKTKDDKKNQVKPPDDILFPETKDNDSKEQRKPFKKNLPTDNEDGASVNNDTQSEGLQHDLDFLATLELRSSEEDERQKALRKEMKEKKRIQQLQQIQELQMKQDALHQAELMGKPKDDKKQKSDEKKKEAAREKRMSTDRKSRDEKSDSGKRKNRKQLQSTDSSDSDEPKKHSIFDIVDDEPTYISMYDKVKARSCKNMQKQEEEKRQEKIKAKFSQLKQSRAKREEKKRSSWDEDSDSDNDRRKPQKVSMDSSTDEDHVMINNKKHRSSVDYDRNKTNDYFSTPSNEEDSRNKLSRKNSRSRIISDTSDDESKRSISKSPTRKEFLSNFESLQRIRDEDISVKDTSDKTKKNSLLNLFGKSDSDDSKLKMSEVNDNRPCFMKSLTGDFSSESESAACNRIPAEMRKKHKKKQKKHKFTYSDDEMKIESSDTMVADGEAKHKHSDKLRRHGNKKDKRKEKIRSSLETDESRDAKHRKDKKTNNCFDSTIESSTNNKKDGKMEDIFGPLSDDSDKETPRLDFTNHGYDSAVSLTNEQSNLIENDDSKPKDKEDCKRKKDKKRKEKRSLFVKEDDNSLDVDAVSKAIEARLFADSVDDDSHLRSESPVEIVSNQQNMYDYSDGDIIIGHKDKHSDKIRRETKEKKKKKKKNREDRQNRKDHHHHHHHHHHHNNINRTDRVDYLSEKVVEELTPKMLLDIPLPNEDTPTPIQKSNDNESPSLPRLTDSPPALSGDNKNSTEIKIETIEDSVDNSIEIDYDGEKSIAVNDIPMPPPYENIVQDISEVPLPKDPGPPSELSKAENFLNQDADVSEDAVRSISNIETDAEKAHDKSDGHASKLSEKKLDEKPRAVISQEETEDAVAALLGESFGGKDDSFQSCYEEAETNPTHEVEIESSAIETENIPEEDAEEMRQAVQNLNASEMEIKPDTPVSDNDLLLIDTDTEENEEPSQDAIDQLPVNIIATNQALNNTPAQNKVANTSNPILSKEKSPSQSLNTNEQDMKIQLSKRESMPQPTSTATPVITSWTLTGNKLIEPHVLSIPAAQMSNREPNDTKTTHITANIVQIKTQQNQGVNASLRPIITQNRVNANAPYQVINHMIRPQLTNMQPPTIKIPPQDPHIMYQKPSGIVISPRMTNDTRQSPKLSPKGEGITSPRLTNMTILSTSPQNLNSPNAIQQRSPGQVTVVRMQQPPLSPIQAMHIPHGARTMVSPNRPNSVLVQTQGAPIHFNRLPVTPVLAPISKMSASNTIQQNKSIVVSSPTMIHQPKIITSETRKNDQRNIPENGGSKIILSPTTLQHSTNPTVMAQNRLISMQNQIHAANINPSLHLPNKVLLNNVNHLGDKIEGLVQKAEPRNHLPFGSPIIHVAGTNHSTSSIIQSSSKPVAVQDTSINRPQSSNVIHTLNSQRLLTTPISSVLQIDSNKASPSVLSMGNIRSSTVLTKLESSKPSGITTASLTNVVMTPLLLKTTASGPPGTIRLTPKNDSESQPETHPIKLLNHLQVSEERLDQKIDPLKLSNIHDEANKQKEVSLKSSPLVQENIAKCETDFEELLKDKTNEIKVTNDPEKKLEVNVGKTVTLFSTNIQHSERKPNLENVKINPTEENACLDTEKSRTATEPKEKEVLIQTNNTENLSKQDDENNIPKIDSEKNKESILSNKIDTRETCFLTTVEEERKEKCFSDNVSNYDTVTEKHDGDNQLKCLDENDSWSAKDVNIESVIKKVDSLCNDNLESDRKADAAEVDTSNEQSAEKSNTLDMSEPMETETDSKNIFDLHGESPPSDKTINKRGGRSARGRKSEKNDRVQTRQISKPVRGAGSAKRGRGRAKLDKKIKSLVNQTANNLPGDVYDFHEDSGDETSTSPNKSESRPRLILTIKSPLSGQTNAIATSSLSITPKDQLKNPEKTLKDEKLEDFASPSANTRKSRRLQEKDVQRNTVDDIIEDVVKGGTTGQPKVGKDNKKRPTRQTGPKTTPDKAAAGSDTRKSPRGVKRTRDRSLSDASVDSSDEKVVKRDETPKETKIPKIVEPPSGPKTEPDPPQPAKTVAPVQIVNPPPNPTPIIKPPKKMISEISAKLASAFEAAAAATPAMRLQVLQSERIPMELDKPAQTSLREPRSAEVATALPVVSEPVAAATGNARVLSVSGGCSAEAGASQACGASGSAQVVSSGGEAALARRVEAAGGGAAPVGATEASDARVQSPALPHRPPSAHRLADRATPLLIRGGDGEGLGVAGSAGASGLGPRLARGYADGASLPRGAHHPAPPPPAPLHAHLPHHAQIAKQVAVIGPHHHHHPGAASRVTITSVPAVSPQGQIGLGEGMYPHFSHQHFQMYQQHFRATQHEGRATASPYSRPLEAEGCEAPTPPLELRRPPSARVPRPAHSPAPAPSPNPAERLIMYAAGCGRSPPPAHGTSRLPSALPPSAAPGPPHASQVPREADSLQMLLRRYPVMWQGLLALKNDSAAVQMHFVGGNPAVAGDTLPRYTDGSTPPLRIAQRMRLEPAQLDQVHRKMKLENEHCMLLALPCGRDHMDVLQQSTNLTAGFITYLQRKQAAGIVNVAPPGHHQAMYTVHIFPSCDFANENLNRIAPDLMHRVADIAHLLIVIATV